MQGLQEKKKAATGLALLATLALLVGLIAVPATGASGDGAATTAKKKKKKCKPGFKRVTIKKKGKKKKKCVKITKAETPNVRATISWANADGDDADPDLFVFNGSGQRAGAGANTIPDSSLSADVVGKNGSETFTDNKPSLKRPFSFGVCYTVGGSAHAIVTITYTNAAGTPTTTTYDFGSSFQQEYPADGVPIPAGYCVH